MDKESIPESQAKKWLDIGKKYFGSITEIYIELFFFALNYGKNKYSLSKILIYINTINKYIRAKNVISLIRYNTIF